MAPKKELDKRYDSAREKLAGVRGAELWHQELAAAHLLRLEQPIKDRPVAGNGSEEQ